MADGPLQLAIHPLPDETPSPKAGTFVDDDTRILPQHYDVRVSVKLFVALTEFILRWSILTPWLNIH